MSNANVSLIQNLYAAFGRGEIATIIGALTPDAEWRANGRSTDYPLIGTWKGPQEVEKFFKGVAETEDLTEFSPREFFAADDRVFVLGRYALTLRHSKGRVASDWIHVFTVRNGKISAFLEFNDSAQFAEAWRN